MNRHGSVVLGLGLVLLGSVGGATACASKSSPSGGGTPGSGSTNGFGAGGFLAGGGAAGSTGLGGSGEEFGGGNGGSSASGGSSGSSGGSSGTGGVSSDAGSYTDPTGTVQLCPNTTRAVMISVAGFSQCTHDVTKVFGCEDAHCIPKNVIQSIAPNDVGLLGSCDATNFCVPDDYVQTEGKFLPKTCTSELGAEGRCISTCVPQVNGLMDALPQDVCAKTERCAPCINPNDGSDTHACEQGCDPGPSAATKAHPLTFASCGKGRGVCVPKNIIPAALLNDLPVDTCTQADTVCAPLEKAQNLKYNFPECVPDNAFVSLLESLGTKLPPGQSGGCVPAFLADDNPIEGIFLTQGTCKAGDQCAPCFNPLDSNKPTGACPVGLPSDDGGGAPPAPSSDAGSTPPKKDGG